jgi:hypothetical protein
LNYEIEFVARSRTGIASVITADGVFDAEVVIGAIRTGRAAFFAGTSSWDRAEVKTVDTLGSPFLFVNWEGSKRNNIHDLASTPSVVNELQEQTRPRRKARLIISSLIRSVKRSYTFGG